MNTQRNRIDVHHHFLPPDFVQYLGEQRIDWTGGPQIPVWNPDIARETMERNGIAQAVASVIPSPFWGDAAQAARWARHSNEFAARIAHDDPTRFGVFATLPLPDVNAAMRELEYAYDTLGVDGVILFASTGNQYLGDSAYEELFQELERRKAIVFIHPNTAPPGSEVPKLKLPYGLVEFVMDTSRAVANLLFNGVLERYPSIRYIVSHAGGTIPYIAWRLTLGETLLPGGRHPQLPKGALHYLQKLYYDTALSVAEYPLAALRQFVPTSQILFGSDWPMVPELVVKAEVAALESSRVLDDPTRAAIDRDNALALFPRFAANAPARRAIGR
jgi:predicted TIM-barrel fold metal-dependent hydrolase